MELAFIIIFWLGMVAGVCWMICRITRPYDHPEPKAKPEDFWDA